jgi:hypothetical protein
MLAYKPAAGDLARSIHGSPTALRFDWTEKNRLESGDSVREILGKAVAYAQKWDEYEEKMASWTPPEEAEGPAKEDADTVASIGDEGKKDADGAAKAEEVEKKAAPKKRKKGEEEPPKPITGAWEAHVAIPPFEKARLRLYVRDEDGAISGSLRCSSLSDGLIQVAGTRTGKKVAISGDGSRGRVSLEAELGEDKLEGKLVQGGTTVEVALAQTSTVYEVAKRPERRKVVEEKEKVKGKPRSPGIDPDLEPLRRAMMGEAAVVVGVSREDEILDCVSAFEEAGIRPILLGAEDAWRVAGEIRGRVAGVLLDQRVLLTEPKTGAKTRNRPAELVEAGVPVAFHSDVEDGAADLPMMASYAVSRGMSPEAALRALTVDAARMYGIDEHVGRLAPDHDADVVLLDGSPLEISSRVLRVWVAGTEIR